MSTPLVIHDHLTLPAACFSWCAVRASGPGGQNVNKVASKIELRFDAEACEGLDAETRARLYELPGVRRDAEGRLLVISQRTRDQQRNLEDAREKVRQLVLRALHRPIVRRPTRPTWGSKLRRMDTKTKTGAKKRNRQRPPIE